MNKNNQTIIERLKRIIPSSFIRLTVTLLLFAGFSLAQSVWFKIYGGTGGDDGYSVRQTSDKGYIITGSTTSFGNSTQVYLIKTDSLGDTLWTATYGGTGEDFGYSVQQTTDSGYIICGTSTSFGNYYQVYLIKTDSTGDTLWTKNYGGTDMEEGWSVLQTIDEDYVIAGTSFGGGVYLIKTNAFGDTMWTRTYGPPYSQGKCVQQTTDGGYIITGYYYNSAAVYLLKTDSLGDTLWTRHYNYSTESDGRFVQQTLGGGYVIVGTVQILMHQFDILLVKTDSLGNNPVYGAYGPGGFGNYTFGTYGQQTADSGFILVGYTNAFGSGEEIYIIKTDSMGNSMWENTFGRGADDYGTCIQQTLDGGYVITGYTNCFGNGTQVYLIKTNAYGYGGMEDKKTAQYSPPLLYVTVHPNPFVSYTVVAGHEKEKVNVFDISGRLVGRYLGSRIGFDIPAGVYFLKLTDRKARPIQVIKIR